MTSQQQNFSEVKRNSSSTSTPFNCLPPTMRNMAVPNTFGVPTQKKNARTSTVTKQEGLSQTSSYIFDERIGRKRRHDPWFAKLGHCTVQSTQKKTSPPTQLLPTNSELVATDINNNNNAKKQKVCLDSGMCLQSVAFEGGSLSISATSSFVTVAVVDLELYSTELTHSDFDSSPLLDFDYSVSFLSDSDTSSPSSPASPLIPLDGSDIELFTFDGRLDLPQDEYSIPLHTENDSEWLIGLFN